MLSNPSGFGWIHLTLILVVRHLVLLQCVAPWLFDFKPLCWIKTVICDSMRYMSWCASACDKCRQDIGYESESEYVKVGWKPFPTRLSNSNIDEQRTHGR
ncbi:hypothetical protein T440DRAFT_469436 [Plenodomus tracheiphilus IPT5]|uniref:Uncharacterized protein n=1 Tax=Plenodomus tracheiphilus IPT5 TaxID=1408161 RepID=A0A6A7B1H0_9PLEO|nr:hypothetical protein T440DRAFT_469436 [Plenodomus tracheiphilus IPT5]